MRASIVLILCSLLLGCHAQFSTTITAILPSSSTVTVPLNWYPGLTISSAMIQAVSASNGKFNYAIQYASAQYGGFVTEICNTPNVAPSYWLFAVNGVQAQVGTDFYVLNNGDEVVWNFTKTSSMNLMQNFIIKN